MKKYVKLVPTMVLALVAAVGCNGKDGGESGPSYRNDLQKAVAELEDGSLNDAQVSSLLSGSVLASTDKEAKYVSYIDRDQTSAEYYYATATDEKLKSDEYGIQDLTKRIVFKSYDDDVVVCDHDYECYPVDVTQRAEGTLDGEDLILSTCWAIVPTRFSEQSVIWKDGSNYNYVHTRNKKASDAYSFKASTSASESLENKLQGAGAMSSIVTSGVSLVNEYYSEYSSYYGSQYSFFDGLEAEKQGDKVTIKAHFNMRYYWYDMNAQWPGEGLAGYFMERGKAWTYTVTIEDGFVTSSSFTVDAVYRVYYHDKQGRTGPGTNIVTEKFIKTLDLEVPDQIPQDSTGKMMTNPYTSYYSFEGGGLGDVYSSFTASRRSLGNFPGEKPSLDLYRESDPSDVGSEFLTLEEFLG